MNMKKLGIILLLSLFHFELFILDVWKYLFKQNIYYEVFSLLIAFIILFLFGFAASKINECVGNSDKEEYQGKWFQRNQIR